MHFAAECGHLDIVKELLKHGAEMTRNEHGRRNNFFNIYLLFLIFHSKI